MKNILRLSLGAVLLAAGSLIPDANTQSVSTDGPGISYHETNPNAGVVSPPPKGGTGATSTILDHGGPLMVAPAPTVYVIWYGKWAFARNTPQYAEAGANIVTDFLHGIGGSPYFAINRTYSRPGATISGGVTYGGFAIDRYSQGTSLTDNTVGSVVARALNLGLLPVDDNGLYFVLTSSDVTETSGFCTQYCGWHWYGYYGVHSIKFSFVGNSATRCPGACTIQTASPNNNRGVDGMISVIAHELEEATTDPELDAWYDAVGDENGDKCAWTFGQNQIQLGNGSYANMALPSSTTGPNGAPAGARYYLIQRNLLRTVSNGVESDYCAVSYDPVTGAFTQ